MGTDFEPYLNHCYRVYFYARTLLLMRENQKLAIAAAFHDLDIWVGKKVDYLPGSVALALDYLHKNQLGYLPDEMKFIITNHHRLRPIKGNIEAEAFRKADLIDLTSGLIHFNIPLQLVSKLEVEHPRLSFTGIVTKKVFRHALTHPLKPFPMIRW